MALLDFIKNRQTQQQSSSAEAKPETAKQMYAREAAQEKSSQRSPSSLPAVELAKVRDAQATWRTATQPPEQTPPSATPQEGAANPQPMAQMAMNQDTAAPSLSPTTAQAGMRAHEQENASPSPVRTPQQTIPRTAPSWER